MPKVVHTIKLRDPVKVGEDEISELKFQKLESGHFWDVELGKMTLGTTLTIAANATGQPIHVMKKLSMVDAMEVSKYVGNALADGQETGEPPSAQ